jgi:hypothetical protein
MNKLYEIKEDLTTRKITSKITSFLSNKFDLCILIRVYIDIEKVVCPLEKQLHCDTFHGMIIRILEITDNS